MTTGEGSVGERRYLGSSLKRVSELIIDDGYRDAWRQELAELSLSNSGILILGRPANTRVLMKKELAEIERVMISPFPPNS